MAGLDISTRLDQMFYKDARRRTALSEEGVAESAPWSAPLDPRGGHDDTL